MLLVWLSAFVMFPLAVLLLTDVEFELTVLLVEVCVLFALMVELPLPVIDVLLEVAPVLLVPT